VNIWQCIGIGIEIGNWKQGTGNLRFGLCLVLLWLGSRILKQLEAIVELLASTSAQRGLTWPGNEPTNQTERQQDKQTKRRQFCFHFG